MIIDAVVVGLKWRIWSQVEVRLNGAPVQKRLLFCNITGCGRIETEGNSCTIDRELLGMRALGMFDWMAAVC